MIKEIISDEDGILTQQQAEELWELGTAGANNAATALSSLIGTIISIKVQKIIVVRLEDLQNHMDDSISSLVLFQVRGQISGQGSIILHIPKQSIITLSSLMLGAGKNDREINEMDISMLHEIGNIMSSSYLDACANLLSLMLIPSPPSMIMDMPHAVLESVIASQEIEDEFDHVFLFKTDMHSSDNDIEAGLLLLPSKSLLDEMLDRFRKIKSK
jgi:chemotaxis protein CheY-P-specific phosphatase CheC